MEKTKLTAKKPAATDKQPYDAPALVELGTIADMTQNAIGANSDTGLFSTTS
jgi:hypothetical protein